MPLNAHPRLVNSTLSRRRDAIRQGRTHRPDAKGAYDVLVVLIHRKPSRHVIFADSVLPRDHEVDLQHLTDFQPRKRHDEPRVSVFDGPIVQIASQGSRDAISPAGALAQEITVLRAQCQHTAVEFPLETIEPLA